MRTPSRKSQRGSDCKYIEFKSIHILQLDGNGMLSRLSVIHVTDTIGCKVGMAILVAGDLELPVTSVSGPGLCEMLAERKCALPFI